jgi:hypothetical protein
MKKVFTIAVCLFLAGYAVAQDLWPASEIWQVPKTSVAPVIDGTMDAVWYQATEEVIDNNDNTNTPTPPDDWFDLYVTGRLMYDETNIYIFFSIQDEMLNVGTATGSDWNYDCVEIYFDADNSKTPGGYDGIDDLQWRFNLSETSIDETDPGYGTGANWGDPRPGASFATLETTLGWNLEIVVPLENVMMDNAAGTQFGFDVQVGDSDSALGTRDTMYRWWAVTEPTWNDASLFGTAELTDRVISEVLDVHRLSAAPVMDGELDAVWSEVQLLPDNVWCETDPTIMDDWSDSKFWFRTAYDDNNQYFFFEVWDDAVNQGTDWQYDSIELYWDADNSKTPGAYDGIDDCQFRINYGDVTEADLDTGFGNGGVAWGDYRTGVTFGITDSDFGWNVEMAMPLANVQLAEDSEFGFEIQLNDADEATRNSMRRYWSTSNNSWYDAAEFGTAILVPGGSGVKDKDATVAGSFALAQNYPNPFNPSTTISYTVDSRTMVRLNVYDVLGQQVASLVNEVKAPGMYTVSFDGSSLTSGVYFYKLYADNKVEAKKMMLVK